MATAPIDDLIERLRAFVRERDWGQFHTPKNLSCALAVEAAELLEQFQWAQDAPASAIPPDKRERIADEIGDVLIYVLLLSDGLGIDPVAAAHRKLAINAERYPVALAKSSSKKYTEL